MILFACARDASLPEIQKYGLRFSGLGHKMYRTLAGARRDCAGKILAVELEKTDLAGCTIKEKTVLVPRVRLSSFRNLNPYLPLADVVAGGGLVVKQIKRKNQVIVIHRRGVWDLPKGKLDDGESIETCASREVREELGIDEATIVGRAGETLHGYTRGRSYEIKTTHWFWMTTQATKFTPQAKEQIDKVIWMPWGDAKKKLAYPVLRDLLKGLNPSRAMAQD
jgi:8-oxo-dGTP pyrophosphatase MutT (NUDIX family)